MIKINGKIPVYISPLFWLIAALIGWINSMSLIGTAIWIAIIFFSVLIHEYGHALTAMAFGQRARIELAALGGLTQRFGGKKLKLWQDFLIVLNGPVAGFILCGAAWALYSYLSKSQPNTMATSIAQITASVNLFWTILNLLPVQPLDGGKLLSIILQSIFGVRGIKIALFISILVSVAIGLLFFSSRQYIAGAIFLMLTFESYRQWKESLNVTDQDQKQEIQQLMRDAEGDIINRPDDALEKFMQARNMAKAGMLYGLATEKAAEIMTQQGQFQPAYDLLEPIKNKLSATGKHLLMQVAFRLNRLDEAIFLGNNVYQFFPDGHTALLIATSHALQGQVEPAVGWLKRAVSDGLTDLQKVLANPEFDAVRNAPQFHEFEKQL